jgi:hypothetical protein
MLVWSKRPRRKVLELERDPDAVRAFPFEGCEDYEHRSGLQIELSERIQHERLSHAGGRKVAQME